MYEISIITGQTKKLLLKLLLGSRSRPLCYFLSFGLVSRNTMVGHNMFKKISLVTRQEWLLTHLFFWTGYGSGCLLVAIVKVVI